MDILAGERRFWRFKPVQELRSLAPHFSAKKLTHPARREEFRPWRASTECPVSGAPPLQTSRLFLRRQIFFGDPLCGKVLKCSSCANTRGSAVAARARSTGFLFARAWRHYDAAWIGGVHRYEAIRIRRSAEPETGEGTSLLQTETLSEFVYQCEPPHISTDSSS